MVHVQTKCNLFDPKKTDIILKKNMIIEEAGDVHFAYDHAGILEEEATFAEINQILATATNKAFVSTIAFVNIDNRPLLQVNTKNGVIGKKNVFVNDQSGTIKLTIWGEKNCDVSESGVYKIRNVAINEYPKGVFSLQSCYKTTFEAWCDENIQQISSNLPFLSSCFSPS